MSFYQKKLALFIWFVIGVAHLQAQQVWPGDVNNNGSVTALDWVYMGTIFGETGPARPMDQIGIEWEAKNITSLWGQTIPGTSADYVFGDCDGNGLIDFADMDAIHANYGLENPPVEIEMAIPGVDGTDPPLFFNQADDIPVTESDILLLEVNLGTIDIPVSSFSGMSFSLIYEPDAVSSIFFFGASEGEGDWEGIFSFQQPVSPGRVDIAVSNLNLETPANSSGVLGRIFIVIEDDVVGFGEDQTEILFNIENIFLLDGEEDSELIPIVNDSIDITVLPNPLSTEEFIDPEKIEAFPNPALDEVFLRTDLEIERVELFNTMGQHLQTQRFEEGLSSGLRKVNLANLPTSIYWLKIHTSEGVVVKKVLRQ